MSFHSSAMLSLIISDIHGNLAALDAVLTDTKRFPIDKTVCLGDIIGYYPNPNEVMDMVGSLKMLKRDPNGKGRGAGRYYHRGKGIWSKYSVAADRKRVSKYVVNIKTRKGKTDPLKPLRLGILLLLFFIF